jgi:acyl-[acyl-carrier-protein]-phospholipid O-acyltransferase/long-chain-fatty-acid--[acyl-carrier-protein] ligase
MNLLRRFGRLLFRLLFRVEVRGSVAAGGNMLVVANHQSFLDAFLLTAFLPFELTYLVHSTIAARWYFKWPLRFIRHLVIDSSNPLAMKRVIALLQAGEHVLIFPEGRVTVTGSRMKVYDGPAFAAAKSGVPILSVHIEGPLYSHFARVGREFPKKWFPKITLTFHQAHFIAMPEARLARERRRAGEPPWRRRQ